MLGNRPLSILIKTGLIPLWVTEVRATNRSDVPSTPLMSAILVLGLFTFSSLLYVEASDLTKLWDAYALIAERIKSLEQ